MKHTESSCPSKVPQKRSSDLFKRYRIPEMAAFRYIIIIILHKHLTAFTCVCVQTVLIDMKFNVENVNMFVKTLQFLDIRRK